jgi:hypothetical protein
VVLLQQVHVVHVVLLQQAMLLTMYRLAVV